ncbi:MAG: hypothetical protein KDK78_05575, partial [Chlamydiia bacterium]|nr:hypothetical protein [Chlamydiia bacterium]
MEGRKCRLLTWMLSLTLCFFSLAMYGGYATQSIMTLERLWELQDAKINAHGQAVITVVDRVSTPGTEKYRSFFYDPEAGLLPIEGEDVQVADLNDEGTAVGSITLNGAYH